MRLDFCVLCGARESLEHHKLTNTNNEITMCRECYDKVRGKHSSAIQSHTDANQS
jgi:ribosome-binding protein aMBF1 (putative translation factor)